MSDTHSATIRFALDMLQAAEKGDYDAIRAFYTPDAKLWHNFTDTWKTLDEHFETARNLRSGSSIIEYANPRISPFDGGYVQQFDSIVTLQDGCQITIPVCLVVRMRDGRIFQREEYLDSAALKKLRV